MHQFTRLRQKATVFDGGRMANGLEVGAVVFIEATALVELHIRTHICMFTILPTLFNNQRVTVNRI